MVLVGVSLVEVYVWWENVRYMLECAAASGVSGSPVRTEVPLSTRYKEPGVIFTCILTLWCCVRTLFLSQGWFPSPLEAST